MTIARAGVTVALLTVIAWTSQLTTLHADDTRIADAQLRARLNSFARPAAQADTNTSNRNPWTAGELTAPNDTPKSEADTSMHQTSAARPYVQGDLSVPSAPPAGAMPTNVAPIVSTDQSGSAPTTADRSAGRFADRQLQPVAFETSATAGSSELQPAAATDTLKPSPSKPFLDLDAAESDAAQSTVDATDDTELIVRFITGTAIVLALCVAVIFGIRKWQQKHGMLPTAGGPSPSRVLETVVIGNRQTISLVQLQGLQAVVGCDATGIKSIVLAPPRFEDALPTDEAVEHLSEADADRSTSSADSTFA
ncbi:MAG: hypothetical protein Fues2KO_14470 [Fuerstiella sp.]